MNSDHLKVCIVCENLDELIALIFWTTYAHREWKAWTANYGWLFEVVAQGIQHRVEEFPFLGDQILQEAMEKWDEKE